MQCDCGSVSITDARNLFQGKAIRCIQCATVGQTGPLSRGWKGGKHTPLTHYHKFKKCAGKRKMEWALSIEDIDNIYERQNGKCAMSGIALLFDHGARNGCEKGNASLDRIDSNKGYIPSNVQLVTKDINMGKQSLTDAEFIAMCKSVVSYTEKRWTV